MPSSYLHAQPNTNIRTHHLELPCFQHPPSLPSWSEISRRQRCNSNNSLAVVTLLVFGLRIVIVAFRFSTLAGRDSTSSPFRDEPRLWPSSCASATDSDFLESLRLDLGCRCGIAGEGSGGGGSGMSSYRVAWVDANRHKTSTQTAGPPTET